MEYAYAIELYRQGETEPFTTWNGVILDHQLKKGSIVSRDSYEVVVTEVVKQALGGDAPLGKAGHVRVVVQKDSWEERQRVEAAKVEARGLGWLLVVEEHGGTWTAWGAPRIEGQTSIGSDLAMGESKAEVAERGLAAIRERIGQPAD